MSKYTYLTLVTPICHNDEEIAKELKKSLYRYRLIWNNERHKYECHIKLSNVEFIITPTTIFTNTTNCVKFCKYTLRGKPCTNRTCMFAHNEDDLRLIGTKLNCRYKINDEEDVYKQFFMISSLIYLMEKVFDVKSILINMYLNKNTLLNIIPFEDNSIADGFYIINNTVYYKSTFYVIKMPITQMIESADISLLKNNHSISNNKKLYNEFAYIMRIICEMIYRNKPTIENKNIIIPLLQYKDEKNQLIAY